MAQSGATQHGKLVCRLTASHSVPSGDPPLVQYLPEFQVLGLTCDGQVMSVAGSMWLGVGFLGISSPM